MYHGTFLQKSGSEMTCIVDINGDYSERSHVAHMYVARLDIPEDAHQGALKLVQLPCVGTWPKRGGEGVLAGYYGT